MPATLPPVRKRLHDLMGATVADEIAHRTWTYRAVRPMPVPPTWKPGQRVIGDCSKGVQFLCKWAKAPDPMHDRYGVYGNSQTIWAALPQITDRNKLEVGDLVVFGPDGRDHVAMIYQTGADPVLWSFGHEGAPNHYRLSYDRREHAFRKLMTDPAAPIVSPAKAHLRAQTGYWSWLAWTLAEGDWRGQGDSNPTVRPNVPKIIEKDWWERREQFVANRLNPNPPTRPH